MCSMLYKPPQERAFNPPHSELHPVAAVNSHAEHCTRYCKWEHAPSPQRFQDMAASGGLRTAAYLDDPVVAAGFVIVDLLDRALSERQVRRIVVCPDWAP